MEVRGGGRECCQIAERADGTSGFPLRGCTGEVLSACDATRGVFQENQTLVCESLHEATSARYKGRPASPEGSVTTDLIVLSCMGDIDLQMNVEFSHDGCTSRRASLSISVNQCQLSSHRLQVYQPHSVSA